MQSDAQSQKKVNSHPHNGNPEFLEHIEIDRKVVHQAEYYSEIFCSCSICKMKFRVVEDPGYHYPVYHWNEIS